MGSTTKNDKIAYKIPGPLEHLTLEVRHSANAWWMDGTKLYKLLNFFEKMTPLKEACFLSGITLKQYRYFARMHPVVEDRRKYPFNIISMRAKKTWIDAINAGDLRACRKWLEATDPETFSLRKHRTAYANLRRRYGMKTGNLTANDEKEEIEKLRQMVEQMGKEIGL